MLCIAVLTSPLLCHYHYHLWFFVWSFQGISCWFLVLSHRSFDMNLYSIHCYRTNGNKYIKSVILESFPGNCALYSISVCMVFDNYVRSALITSCIVIIYISGSMHRHDGDIWNKKTASPNPGTLKAKTTKQNETK